MWAVGSRLPLYFFICIFLYIYTHTYKFVSISGNQSDCSPQSRLQVLNHRRSPRRRQWRAGLSSTMCSPQGSEEIYAGSQHKTNPVQTGLKPLTNKKMYWGEEKTTLLSWSSVVWGKEWRHVVSWWSQVIKDHLLQATEKPLWRISNTKAACQSNLCFVQNRLLTGTENLQAKLSQLGFILHIKELDLSKIREGTVLSSTQWFDFSDLILAWYWALSCPISPVSHHVKKTQTNRRPGWHRHKIRAFAGICSCRNAWGKC